MLTRVEISGFRTCSHVVLDTSRPITALWGPAASGKTSILKAISRVARVASDRVAFFPERARDALPHCTALDVASGEFGCFRYTLDVGAGDGVATRNESVSISQGNSGFSNVVSRNGDRVSVLPTQPNLQISVAGAVLPRLPELFPGNGAVERLTRALLGTFRFVRYYTALPQQDEESLLWDDETREILGEDEDVGISRELKQQRRRDNQARDALPIHSTVFDLEAMYEHDLEAFREVESLLGPNGLGVIDAIYISPSLKVQGEAVHHVRFGPPGLGRPTDHTGLSFDQLASSVRRVIETVILLVYKPGAVLLWDHPEDGIDPRLLHKTVSLMRTYTEGGQLIIATHSPIILNALSTDEVRLVNLVEGETTVRGLSPEEHAWATQYLHETGTLADFLESLQEV